MISHLSTTVVNNSYRLHRDVDLTTMLKGDNLPTIGCIRPFQDSVRLSLVVS